MYETEIKFKVDSLEEIKQKLLQLNAEQKNNCLETNYCYDTEDKKFHQKDHLLRLRKAGNKITLTFKGEREFDGKLKKRKEIEVNVEDFDKTKNILEHLGFSLYRIWEKDREIFLLDNTEIVLEKIPFTGSYIEIEGSAENIEMVATKLGFNLDDGYDYTYGKEAEQWFKKGYQLTFNEEEKYKQENE